MALQPDAPAAGGGFEVVRRGYDQLQVDNHLRRLDTEIQILAADRDAALDQSAQLARELNEARAWAERLRAQARGLIGPPQNVQGMSERMRSMLRLAEDEASEMLRRADTDAGEILRRAEADAHAMIQQARAQAAGIASASHADAQRTAEEIGHARAVLAADAQAVRERIAADEYESRCAIQTAEEQARVNREATWAQSESHRKTVEEDFTIAMDRRRSEALSELAQRREQLDREISRTRAETAVAAKTELQRAHTAAEEITHEAGLRVHELLEFRERLLAQLGDAGGALGQLLGNLAPLPEKVVAAAESAAASEPVVEQVTPQPVAPQPVAPQPVLAEPVLTESLATAQHAVEPPIADPVLAEPPAAGELPAELIPEHSEREPDVAAAAVIDPPAPQVVDAGDPVAPGTGPTPRPAPLPQPDSRRQPNRTRRSRTRRVGPGRPATDHA